MISTLVIFPLEVTRTRMVVDSGAAAYRGALDCAVQLARREGLLAFYKVCVPVGAGWVWWLLAWWWRELPLCALEAGFFAIMGSSHCCG